MEDYNINITSDRDLKSMMKGLSEGSNELDEIEKSMNKMIKMIGQAVIPKDIEGGVI